MTLISCLCIGCNSDEAKMTATEQFLADKYNAETISFDFKTVETKTNGELTEDRKFISVEIKNPTDIEKIMSDNEYSNKRGLTIAKFVMDSLQFDEIPFQPKELQIDFINESGFFLLNSENKKTINYELN
ncbi:hypothetical protein [Leeuwenhoekiella sp. MAR_2009_132]|uniref:hypothetical protein n=1 Tax=Leeuwenhoekiella sp. MAR_2009_132 TaxID=1392489 RepID=UPI000F683810|nr:hypothetical protein [Leeuwenhoekiella sp. MAR_2009_132]